MSQIPSSAYRFDISATYSQNTIPRQLKAFNALEQERWAKIVLEHGQLDLEQEGSPLKRLSPSQPGVVAPQKPFRVVATGEPVSFRLEYFHEGKQLDAQALAQALAR